MTNEQDILPADNIPVIEPLEGAQEIAQLSEEIMQLPLIVRLSIAGQRVTSELTDDSQKIMFETTVGEFKEIVKCFQVGWQSYQNLKPPSPLENDN